jgi:anti-sigma factor RsiW
MQCADLVRYLSDYIDNNLSAELTREAQEHLATCQNCHIVLDSTQRTILLFRQRGQQVGLAPRRHESLFGQLALALAERPPEPGCE